MIVGQMTAAGVKGETSGGRGTWGSEKVAEDRDGGRRNWAEADAHFVLIAFNSFT